MDEDKPTKSRVITGTFKYCNSGREEEKQLLVYLLKGQKSLN